MKTLILCFFMLFLFIGTSSSQHKSCCKEMTATEKMASFSGEKDFREAHLSPLPFSLAGGNGNMISFNTSDGLTGSAYEVKPENAGNKYVLMFHEFWGLNDYIKKEAEELQSQLGDVTVLAVDLYDGKVATTQEEASKYVQEVKSDRATNIIKGAADYAGSNAVFGTIGWCFGGAWSNQAAIELGDKCKACVIYYGMPEEKTERLSLLKAPVLGIFAKQDKRITPEVAAKFEENLKSLNIPVEIKIYDAVHAFANPSNPKHDVEATKDAKERTLSFLKEKMK
jgi:carboxymethylenebutenolidase